jgi:hypothetical protein
MACLLALVACSGDETVEAFDLPDWMDPDFGAEIPDYGGLIEGLEPTPDQCHLLVAATEDMPFESTPEAVNELARTFDELSLSAPTLEPAASAVANALRADAERGADRRAMLGLWFDRASSAALRELSYLAMNQCRSEFQMVALGPVDRLIELARRDHPDSEVLEDIGSWGMSITGEPRTIYWAFGYLGDEPVRLCQEMAETLASAGFDGTELEVHDAELEDLAQGIVGGSCRGA